MVKFIEIGPKEPVTVRGGDGVHRLKAFQVSSLDTGIISETVPETGSLGRLTLTFDSVTHEEIDGDGRVILQDSSVVKVEVSGDALVVLASVLRRAFPLGVT